MQLILYPAQVQGEGAKESIVKGIHTLEQAGVDVMLVGRGGGSIEDLWACLLYTSLSEVYGVGKVNVMVTLRSTSEKVVEKDEEQESETVTEQDSQGGTRTTSRSSSSGTTVYGESDSSASAGQEPYVTKELTPSVEGVVVIAQGGDQPVTVQNITEAVQALFNVDTHKIKVMKLNEN